MSARPPSKSPSSSSKSKSKSSKSSVSSGASKCRRGAAGRKPGAAAAAAAAADRVGELRAGLSAYLPRAGLPVTAAHAALRWVPRFLVVGAVLFAWGARDALLDRFAAAVDALVAMFPSRRRPGRDPQGFLRTLCRQSPALLDVVAARLRRRVRLTAGRDHWRVGGGGGVGVRKRKRGWLAFGADGSRVACPRTAANELALGCAGRERTGPQLFVTTLFHVGTGLPWAFRRGTGKASERGHLLEMLDTLPPGALLLADAGFTGYDLMNTITGGGGGGGGGAGDGGRHFLIRVGANVRLLRGLGWCCDEHDGVVYLWPDAAQKRAKAPPLVLRLVTLTDGRNRTMHLLTDVLDAAAMSDADARDLYARRWLVEVLYRSLKQTMGRREMACGDPDHAGAELDWAVVGLWVLGLMAADAVAAAGHAPTRVSVAAAPRAVRRAIGAAPPWLHRDLTLAGALAGAVRDEYRRAGPKAARAPVNKKRDRPPGDPLARTATPEEVALAAALKRELRAA